MGCLGPLVAEISSSSKVVGILWRGDESLDLLMRAAADSEISFSSVEGRLGREDDLLLVFDCDRELVREGPFRR